MGPPNPEFPNAADGDSDDVRWALETAGAMWSQGDSKEALRWLKKAADTASEEGADMRSLSLAKIAADLRSAVGDRMSEDAPAPSAAPSAAPPLATASVSAAASPSTLPQARRPLPPPPPPKKGAPAKRALPAPTRGKSTTPEPPEPSGAPPAVQAPPRGQAPPPAARATPAKKSSPGHEQKRQPAKTVRMARTPKPGDAVESAPGAPPESSPSFRGADSVPDSGKTTVSAHPISAAPASAAPISAPPVSAAPVSAPPASAAPVSSPPASAAPVSAPGPESAPYNPGLTSEPPNSLGDRTTLVKPLAREEIDAYYQQPPPSVEINPIDPGTAAVIHHQAVRVSIHPLQDQPGVFLTHILSEGEPAPRGTSEALLVALDPRIKLIKE